MTVQEESMYRQLSARTGEPVSALVSMGFHLVGSARARVESPAEQAVRSVTPLKSKVVFVGDP